MALSLHVAGSVAGGPAVALWALAAVGLAGGATVVGATARVVPA